MKNINVKVLNTNITAFFRLWLEFLKPYHKLSNKEIDIIAFLLHKRYNLKKIVNDDAIVDKLLFDKEVKEELKIKMGYEDMQILNNMFTTLRKKKVIQDNKIMKGLIPNLTEEVNFKLVFSFNINET